MIRRPNRKSTSDASTTTGNSGRHRLAAANADCFEIRKQKKQKRKREGKRWEKRDGLREGGGGEDRKRGRRRGAAEPLEFLVLERETSSCQTSGHNCQSRDSRLIGVKALSFKRDAWVQIPSPESYLSLSLFPPID